MTFIRSNEGGRVKKIQTSDAFRATRALILARKNLPALRRGLTAPLWLDSRESKHDDGTYLYARYISGKPEQTVLVGFNLSQNDSTLSPALISAQQRSLVPEGTVFERIPLPGIDDPGTPPEFATVIANERIDLLLKADSVSLWRVKKQTTEPQEK